MPYQVIFTDEADDTFDYIGNQIQERWGERERNTFRKRVYEVVDSIADFPFIFKSVGDDVNLRKAFIHKNCSMFYRINNSNIEVLFFWDNRQDPIF